MNERSFEEKIPDEEGVKREGVQYAPKGDYEKYKSLGGIINEKDYQSALDRAEKTTTLDRPHFAEAEVIAKVSGIALYSSSGSLDPRVALYGVLRGDTNPAGEKYHHSQMVDQRLFAEVLRMLGDEDSLQKLIAAHPNIAF
ncbi:MAG: hypothetical protein AAB495_02625 [Patescibacteria group bacterium]